MGVIVARPAAIMSGSSSGSGGGGAPTNATYLVLTSSVDLSQERILRVGEGLKIQDDGPGQSLFIFRTDVWNEIPSGTIDNSNMAFTLQSLPTPANSLRFYVNGIRQTSGSACDYVLSGSSIIMNYAPHEGDNLLADYTSA